MAARTVGATVIIAVDLVENRLQLARGRRHGCRQRPRSGAGRQDHGHDRWRSINYSLDTTGSDKAVGLAMQVLASRHLRLRRRFAAEIDGIGRAWLAPVTGGTSVYRILQGDAVPDQFVPALVELWRQGRFPFDRLVKTYELSEINQAAHDRESGKIIKRVLLMSA
jgi:aryl-alcohol dehydrogenase